MRKIKNYRVKESKLEDLKYLEDLYTRLLKRKSNYYNKKFLPAKNKLLSVEEAQCFNRFINLFVNYKIETEYVLEETKFKDKTIKYIRTDYYSVLESRDNNQSPLTKVSDL